MIKLSFKVALPLVLALFIISGISCTQTVEKTEDFTVRITDKPWRWGIHSTVMLDQRGPAEPVNLL
jgi:hypothetical protein